MEELDVNTLSPIVIYSILESLREIDPAGTKNSDEAKRARHKIGLKNNLTEKQISKLCRTCKTFYKDYGDTVRFKVLNGKGVNESVLEHSTDKYPVNLAAFVFWENQEARKLFPGKNVVKYSKEHVQEILDI